MIDTEKMRKRLDGYSWSSSHYEGCEYVHPYCAIELLLREVEGLRERTVLAEHTLNESYDEGSPQAMALAMAILDGDKNAIADAKRNMQKRQERAAAYACPSCDIDDGESSTDLEREVERLRSGYDFATVVSAVDYAMTDEEISAMHTALLNSGKLIHPHEPNWLPAPDTMPEELAPAQMVEWSTVAIPASRYRDIARVKRSRADNAPWEVVDSYRPLYSDSGLPFCSAEGLHDGAKYVYADGFAVWQTDAKPRYSGAGWGGDGFSVRAPTTHRKPGDWRDSLMEVVR